MALKGQNEITNGEDIIDSRDVIARIEWLQPDRDALQEALDEAAEELQEANDSKGDHTAEDFEALENALNDARKALDEYDEGDEGDEGRELKTLLSLQEEAEGYSPDWRYGATLIRDTYFTEYAQQLAEDIGAINRDASWPNTCIDWEKAAEELQQDYTSVSFDGHDYWIR